MLKALLIVVAATSPAPAPSTATWHQWRGPDRSATVTGDWPDTLDDKTLVKCWTVELGESYATPIVTTDRLFTVETKDEQKEVVRAFDRATGKRLWEHAWTGSMDVPFFARKNGSWVRSTPAYDPATDRLYVGGMREVLVCIDATRGEEVWRVDFPARYESELPGFGFVCSPIVDGDHVYVQAGAAVCKLDKNTGRVIWRRVEDAGGMWGGAFSSPVIAEILGVRQLVVQTRSTLIGMELEAGQPLWSTPVKAFRGMNILTPVVVGERVFTAAYGGSSHAFDVSRDEAGDWAVAEAWQVQREGYMSTPVVVDGHIYLHERRRRIVCINLEDGARPWTSSAKFSDYSSMVTNGKSILALDSKGKLVLFKADPAEYRQVAERKVGENTWAHLVVCGNEVYVRSLKGLTAYRWGE